MNAIISYFQRNSTAIWQALGQHLAISVAATLITILIAIPLAILMMNHRRMGEFTLQIAGMIQTIPSLAVLGILIPIVGIGIVPSIIALVLYAIMPVFSNTYTGLTTIAPTLTEAANGFGLSKTYKLFRIQLPLALPMILSGIRIAVVMIIGTATLAALIGGGGLGTYILLGIQTNNNAALLVGAISAAILALLASFLIKLLTRVSVKKLLIGGLALIVLGGGVFGYKTWQHTQHETITIAGKLGGEPEILINIYKQLIERSNKNVTVQVKPNFGGTSFLFNGLNSRKIDIYPEFTGTVLQSLVKTRDIMPHNPQRAWQQAKTLLKQQHKMTYMAPMKYQNNYALAVTKHTAQQYHLNSIGNLASLTKFRAAFDPDFYEHADGYPGLKKNYGLNFSSVRTMEPSLRYEALAKDKIDVTDAYTTDPQIRQYGLVTLRDTKQFFPPYQGAPLMLTSFAKKHPNVVHALRVLHGKISAHQMQEMNYEVTIKHEKAAKVAHRFLVQQHLLAKEQ